MYKDKVAALFWFTIASAFYGRVVGSPQAPHVVLILADDLGWNDVGYHGSEIKTPTIDRLAASGVKLERHYVQPTCTPSRSVLMSGKYQIHTGVHSVLQEAEVGGLPLELTTLPEVLGDAGYTNYLVGKWHLGFSSPQYTPTARGFHSMKGLYTSARDHFTYKRCVKTNDDEGVSCGIDYHDDTPGNLKADFDASGKFSAHLQTKHAVSVIRDHEQNSPMFLYLAYSVPHFPVQSPQEYRDMYDNVEHETRRTYAGMVTCMDEGINEVYEALVETGMWNNTILIFSSDNGGSEADFGGGSNTPLRGEKSSMFEGGIRVPAFVTGPHVQRGVVNTEMIHISDWFPTLSHLAGADTSHLNLDGFNVWKTISENDGSPRSEILINIFPPAPPVGENLYPDLYDVRINSGIISGRWKLITGDPYGEHASWMTGKGEKYEVIEEVARGQNIFLFDIINDPYEEHEVSAENKDIVMNMLSKLAKYNATAVPVIDFENDFDGASPKNGALMPWRQPIEKQNKKEEL